MSLFLDVVPVEEAQAAALSIAPKPVPETVALTDAFERVLAADVTAGSDIPGFSRSVVDGYAVVASDTTGAGEALPAMLSLTGRVFMGESATGAVVKGACMYVPTGGILPEGADAMVMVEDCELIGDEVLVQRAVAPGENVVMRGEDFSAGDVVLHRGRRCSPRDLGVLASVGCESVAVAKRPLVGIISTGNELVRVNEEQDPDRCAMQTPTSAAGL